MQITLDKIFTENNVGPIVRDRMSYETDDDDGRVVLHWPEEMEKTCQMPRMKRNYPCRGVLRKNSLFCAYHHCIVKKRGIDQLRYCVGCGNLTPSYTNCCDRCGGGEIRDAIRYERLRREKEGVNERPR